jgi:hypothetical protein
MPYKRSAENAVQTVAKSALDLHKSTNTVKGINK